MSRDSGLFERMSNSGRKVSDPSGGDDTQPPLPENTEPFKALVLDAAQSYLATGKLPVSTATRPSAERGLPTTR